jgi:serine/threonine protein phosphatase 1
MFNFAPRREQAKPRGPRNQRAYVIGDIHGRLDLLDQLLSRIHSELERRPGPKTILAFVGDLIDRGPNSAQVIERLRTYRHAGVRSVFILGNHEEVLLRILLGEAELITKWCWFGGRQCLESYGVAAERIAGLDGPAALAVIREAIPAAHVQFLETFVDSCRFGDYLFVHAGIRPGVELAAQLQSDLRWIREPFLLDDTDHGFVVVHGHTISEQVEERPNRIGIDTGAYQSGILTALAIENDDRWYIDTRELADPGRSVTD